MRRAVGGRGWVAEAVGFGWEVLVVRLGGGRVGVDNY